MAVASMRPPRVARSLAATSTTMAISTGPKNRALGLVAVVAGLAVAVSAQDNSSEPTVLCPAMMPVGQTHSCYVSAPGGLTALELLKTSPVAGEGGAFVVATASPSSSSAGLYTFALPVDLKPGAHEVRASSASSQKVAEVEVAPEDAMMLLELDKAKYKPGQTVLMRVLALAPATLAPTSGRKVELAVTGPNGFVLFKAEDPTDSAGVASFEYPIASEPLLGVHTVRATVLGVAGAAASAGEQRADFTVEEYVLPRFEVNVTSDLSRVFSSSKEGTLGISGRISAVYTFGEGVRGTAVVRVLAEAEQPLPRGRVALGPSSPAPLVVLGSQSAVKLWPDTGAAFNVVVDQGRLRAGRNLMIHASVTDAATGEQQNATAEIPIFYQGSEVLVDLSATDEGDLFFPGLPISLRLELTQPGGGSAVIGPGGAGDAVLIVERTYVNIDSGRSSDRVSLSALDFDAGGVALLEAIPNPADNASCCDPLASPESLEEYWSMKACCTSRVQIWVELAGERLWASDPGKKNMLCLSRAYSQSGHFLSVAPPAASGGASGASGADEVVVVLRSTVDFASLRASVDLLAICGGSVVATMSLALPKQVTAATAGFWEASLPVGDVLQDAVGNCNLVVVGRTSEDGIALTTSTAFFTPFIPPFKLSASFSASEVKPGEKLSVNFTVTGLRPGTEAHVFYASLDRSAELLGPRGSVSEASLLESLAGLASDRAEPGVATRVWRECAVHGADSSLVSELGGAMRLLKGGAAAAYVTPKDIDNAWGKSLGKNCPRPIPGRCEASNQGIMMLGAMADPSILRAVDAPGAAVRTEAAASVEAPKARTFFPETWLWDQEVLGDTGGDRGGAVSRSVGVKAPDTITSWSLDAFATTPQGLASVRADTPLRVFKPMFVELRLPHSAVCREELEVTIALFNFAEGRGTITADVSIFLPDGIEAVGEADPLPTFLVQAPEGSAGSVILRLRPTVIGPLRIMIYASSSGLTDVLTRTLLVQPEGVEVRQTKNLVLELPGPSAIASSSSSSSWTTEETIFFDLPDDIVEGSLRGSVSVVGDLLGPTISGLEHLLRIPTGCGEQNMITLAPNVFVAKYLLSVGRLTQELRRRITNNMIVGYGRQLTYRHEGGSFSAFGRSDKEGSTWLTAFVLKTFAEVHASGLVSIDAAVLEAAATWLLEQQALDGSFAARGSVIHREMMGALGGDGTAESSLTSYVTSALAKAVSEVPILNVEGLANALERAEGYLQNTTSKRAYTQMLRTLALFQAGLLDGAAAANEVLDLSFTTSAAAGSGGGAALRFWTAASTAAQDIELTGYGVLLLSLAGRLSEAFQGARWLLQRRSASGGFASTQDTVVALGALATYATAVAGGVDLTIEASGGGGFSESLTVTDDSVDVLQTVPIPAPDEEVKIVGFGQGTALVIAEVVYNVKALPTPPCYDLKVTWFEEETDGPVSLAPTRFSSDVPARVVKGCASRRPDCTTAADEGMWLMSIGLFTGYAPIVSSLERFRALNPHLKRFELGDGQVYLYLEDFNTSGATCVHFDVFREHMVRSVQARSSSVYEYYAPERSGTTMSDFMLERSRVGPKPSELDDSDSITGGDEGAGGGSGEGVYMGADDENGSDAGGSGGVGPVRGDTSGAADNDEDDMYVPQMSQIDSFLNDPAPPRPPASLPVVLSAALFALASTALLVVESSAGLSERP